jgi:hypothetical protein
MVRDGEYGSARAGGAGGGHQRSSHSSTAQHRATGPAYAMWEPATQAGSKISQAPAREAAKAVGHRQPRGVMTWVMRLSYELEQLIV